MARKTWDIGNLFAVPLNDGSYSLGQVVGREAQVLNSITCAFYKTRLSADALHSIRAVPDQEDLIAIQFITKDLLTRRVWKVLGTFPVTLPRKLFPHEDKRAHGWIGAKMIGSGNIVHLLNAWFGLEPWNQMLHPNYFDQLLLHPGSRPQN
jgi:Immunity protein 26